MGVVEEIVGSLPEEVVTENPRVLLHLARLAETAHLMDRRGEVLSRAFRDAVSIDDAVLWRELEAERARDLMWDERTRLEARSCAEAVLQAAGSEEAVARARALDVLGRLGGWFSSAGPNPEAERPNACAFPRWAASWPQLPTPYGRPPSTGSYCGSLSPNADRNPTSRTAVR